MAGSPEAKAAEELLLRASSGGSEVPDGSTPPAPGVDVGPKTEAAQAGKLPGNGTGIAFRRSLNKTGRYQRNPVHDNASLALMEEHGVGYRCTHLSQNSEEIFHLYAAWHVVILLTWNQTTLLALDQQAQHNSWAASGGSYTARRWQCLFSWTLELWSCRNQVKSQSSSLWISADICEDNKGWAPVLVLGFI